jgi:hypothetical protein
MVVLSFFNEIYKKNNDSSCLLVARPTLSLLRASPAQGSKWSSETPISGRPGNFRGRIYTAVSSGPPICIP